MNKEAMLRVADTIEAHPHQFDMNHWGDPTKMLHFCDSAGCIGGWTEAVFGVEDARALLGLTPDQAEELFYPHQFETIETGVWGSVTSDPYLATAPQAADLLRKIASGELEFVGGFYA